MKFIKVTGDPSGDVYLIAPHRIIYVRQNGNKTWIRIQEGKFPETIHARESIDQIQAQLER